MGGCLWRPHGRNIECLYSWRPVARAYIEGPPNKGITLKILLVEDDKQIAEYVAKGLREKGHVVDRADNGRDGLYLATGERYEVMIVDRMLPHMDGLSLVKAARSSGVKTPVGSSRIRISAPR